MREEFVKGFVWSVLALGISVVFWSYVQTRRVYTESKSEEELMPLMRFLDKNTNTLCYIHKESKAISCLKYGGDI